MGEGVTRQGDASRGREAAAIGDRARFAARHWEAARHDPGSNPDCATDALGTRRRVAFGEGGAGCAALPSREAWRATVGGLRREEAAVRRRGT